MAQEKKDDLFIDAEETNFFGNKDQSFSHEALVMGCLRTCAETGSHELRPGWFNEKIDNLGNKSFTYVEDTRAKFISAVKMAETNMACDLDLEAREKIRDLKSKLKFIKNSLLEKQWAWFQSLSTLYKDNAVKQYGTIYPNFFNVRLCWYQEFTEYEVDIHRRILAQLIKLTKRLGFYKAMTREE